MKAPLVDARVSCYSGPVENNATPRTLWVPMVGDLITLAEPWEFTLQAEYRSSSMREAVGEGKKPVLPEGTVLEFDRVYVRQGADDYASVTFRVRRCPETKYEKQRFWVSLREANTITYLSTDRKTLDDQKRAARDKKEQRELNLQNVKGMATQAVLSSPEYRTWSAGCHHFGQSFRCSIRKVSQTTREVTLVYSGRETPKSVLQSIRNAWWEHPVTTLTLKVEVTTTKEGVPLKAVVRP